jgi:hypothetical protein
MKYKTLLLISNLIITILTTLSFCITALWAKNTDEQYNLIIDKIDGLELAYTQSTLKINIDKALLDKIDEQSQYITRLEMENAAQHDYIVGMGKTWDRWADENNIGVEVSE